MNTLEKTNIKQSNKLGFTKDEGSELAISLKQLLANYQVFYHKLRRFHWNVEGNDFFELHEEFEKEYNTTKTNIDIIAERIRVFGIKPMLSLNDIMESSKIEEPKETLSATSMVTEILKDFEILHENMLEALRVSLDIGDNVTEQILTDFMRHIETRNWMFTSWCK